MPRALKHASRVVLLLSRAFPEAFFLFVLAGEDPVDHIQRKQLKEGGSHPATERIMRIHVAEEARHIAFARHWLRERAPAGRPAACRGRDRGTGDLRAHGQGDGLSLAAHRPLLRRPAARPPPGAAIAGRPPAAARCLSGAPTAVHGARVDRLRAIPCLEAHGRLGQPERRPCGRPCGRLTGPVSRSPDPSCGCQPAARLLEGEGEASEGPSRTVTFETFQVPPVSDICTTTRSTSDRGAWRVRLT